MKKHTTYRAKRVRTGLYTYRGWTIELIEGNDHWNMRPTDESEWTDAASSFTDAKFMIDAWMDEENSQYDHQDPRRAEMEEVHDNGGW